MGLKKSCARFTAGTDETELILISNHILEYLKNDNVKDFESNLYKFSCEGIIQLYPHWCGELSEHEIDSVIECMVNT